MKITFKSKRLKKTVNTDRTLFKVYGQKRGKCLKRRLDQLQAADSLEQVRHAPGNFHELIGNRKGQWACKIDHSYRLIFEPHERPIPTDDNGRYLWQKIKGVAIVEIIDYH